MDVSCACVRAVGVFSRACVRVDVLCACVTVLRVLSRACVALTYRVHARRVRVVTSVRARRRLVCVCAVCVLSRACVRADVSLCMCAVCVLSRGCVRVDVSCACLLFVAGARALWTFGPFPAGDGYPQLSIMILYGLLHARLARRTLRLVRSKACDRMCQLYASLVTEQLVKHRCT